VSGVHRGTGGNRFIESDAGIPDLMRVIHEGLYELRDWAAETEGTFDLAKVTVDTRRIPSGRISVTVSADLTTTAEDA
jgi:hypothetical protein